MNLCETFACTFCFYKTLGQQNLLYSLTEPRVLDYDYI